MITVFTRDGEVIIPESLFTVIGDKAVDWTLFTAKDVDMIVFALLGYPLAAPTSETLDNWLRFRQAVYLLSSATLESRLDELLYDIDSLIADRFPLNRSDYLTTSNTFWFDTPQDTEKPQISRSPKEKTRSPAPFSSPVSERPSPKRKTRSSPAPSFSSPVQEPISERPRRSGSPVAKTKPTFAKLQAFMTNGTPRT